jgi:hypothetical protein
MSRCAWSFNRQPCSPRSSALCRTILPLSHGFAFMIA